ncbi:MAG: hypothetical protein ACR65U_06700 [Methylocystis sp.]
MRRPARAVIVSFALASCVATNVPAFATSVVRPPRFDAQIKLAGGGLQQRCWMAQTPQGARRRCRDGGSGGHESWSVDSGKSGHAESGDSGDKGSRGGWSGVYGGWNGGYGSGQGE